MTKSTRIFANLMLAVAAVAFVAGCAGGPEFQGAPQEGARRTDTYPSFGRMPKAATTQITPEEKAQMLSNLDGDRTRLAATRSSAATLSDAQAAALRKQAQEEVSATLKQIESGE
ncbi:hypothetical protein ACFQ3K_09270 [Brucella gallinifaecis]|uniref:Lipoprotein n=1 Tax=Brucella gallinifaecis TaxID=215590 RepID=A0A502BR60_9HYPH|nr:hypothetical protein [Brucella gallinifaecis]TPF75638.1 hypothetical protein FHY56_06750 [Brucella gallinifaecis]